MDLKYDTNASVMYSHKQRLYVDMDGTLTEFLPQASMEPLYQQGYFRNLPPHSNVVAAVRSLICHHTEIEVFVLSAYLPDSLYALAEKHAWVDEYLPELDKIRKTFHRALESHKDFEAVKLYIDSPLHNLKYVVDKEVQMTENFYIDEKGIHFIYDPYEIASFAAGTIDIFVPYKIKFNAK